MHSNVGIGVRYDSSEETFARKLVEFNVAAEVDDIKRRLLAIIEERRAEAATAYAALQGSGKFEADAKTAMLHAEGWVRKLEDHVPAKLVDPADLELAQREATAARARYERAKTKHEENGAAYLAASKNGNVVQYVVDNHNGEIVFHDFSPAQPNKGESEAEAVNRLRAEIAARKDRVKETKKAPRSRSERKRLAAERLAKVKRGLGSVKVHESGSILVDGAYLQVAGDPLRMQILDLLFDAFRDDLVEHLARKIDASPESTLPDADERARIIADLEAANLRAEYDIESLIQQARAKGATILRTECDPRVLLGLAPTMPKPRKHI